MASLKQAKMGPWDPDNEPSPYRGHSVMENIFDSLSVLYNVQHAVGHALDRFVPPLPEGHTIDPLLGSALVERIYDRRIEQINRRRALQLEDLLIFGGDASFRVDFTPVRPPAFDSLVREMEQEEPADGDIIRRQDASGNWIQSIYRQHSYYQNETNAAEDYMAVIGTFLDYGRPANRPYTMAQQRDANQQQYNNTTLEGDWGFYPKWYDSAPVPHWTYHFMIGVQMGSVWQEYDDGNDTEEEWGEVYTEEIILRIDVFGTIEVLYFEHDQNEPEFNREFRYIVEFHEEAADGYHTILW